MFERDHKKNLSSTRRKFAIAKQRAKATKDIVEALSLWKMKELIGQINWFFDWLILLPLLLAVAKDLADLIFGILPVIDNILVYCVGGITVLILYVLGASKAKSTQFMARKVAVIIVGLVIEQVPGLDLLPVQTLIVLISFYLLLVERKQAELARKKQEALQAEYA